MSFVTFGPKESQGHDMHASRHARLRVVLLRGGRARSRPRRRGDRGVPGRSGFNVALGAGPRVRERELSPDPGTYPSGRRMLSGWFLRDKIRLRGPCKWILHFFDAKVRPLAASADFHGSPPGIFHSLSRRIYSRSPGDQTSRRDRTPPWKKPCRKAFLCSTAPCVRRP